MSEFHDFFSASVGAAAALIGLLFVAITLAPEKVFGRDADATRRGGAIGAFTALGNIFFVSLAALTPQVPGAIIAVIAVIAIAQIVSEGTTMARLYPKLRGLRHYGLKSLCIYVLELVLALRVVTHTGPPEGLVYVVLGLYAYSLGTAWTLLGARDIVKS